MQAGLAIRRGENLVAFGDEGIFEPTQESRLIFDNQIRVLIPPPESPPKRC